MVVEKCSAKRSASEPQHIEVESKKRARAQNHTQRSDDDAAAMTSTTTRNYFASLSYIGDKYIDVLIHKNNTHKTSTPNTHNTQNNSEDNIKVQKIMPSINIFNQYIKDIINVIKNSCKITNFNIKKITNTKHAIYTHTFHDFKKIINILKIGQVPSYTYTPKCIKNQSFLLKELDRDDDIIDIFENIKHHESESLKIEKVTQFKAKNVETSFFIVTISNTSAVKSLFAIKYVLYRAVGWERIRRDGITQCFRCQGFGHTAVNCSLRFRCVKCSVI